jgi:hypothetical protein
MPHYKDINNKLYFLDDAAFEHLLPAGCVQITDAEAESIRNLNKPPLADYKAQAQDAIDQSAGRARARYITVAPGQEATYQAKSAEADAYVAAGRPADTSAYHILTAEAAARGVTVSAVADLVRATRDQWTQLAAAIEGIRIGGKLAVENAADHAGVDAARDAAIAQLGAI